MEEATLRAKIQAMKNLLEAKRQHAGSAVPAAAHSSYSRPSYAHYQSRQHAPASGPVNRSWSRFPPPAAAASRLHAATGSSNKVWRRQDATEGAKTAVSPPMVKNQAWKRPLKVAANKSKSLQLQVLRLEDGEYAKARGGFSLVRAGVKKPMAASSSGNSTASATAPMSVSRTNSNSVHIGGVKYVVANGGKVLKRCSEERKPAVVYRTGSMSLTTKSGAARAALVRAKATIQRARSKRLHVSKKARQVRTVYCSFYNRFGYCKNKDACRFIHDSRRVAMCRKFLKNECSDPKCLLSHQHDENKVPDCKMFLRGACTREGCKYRHVKVSAAAELCESFTQGYCPKGSACPLRHELPLITRKSPRSTSPAASSSKPSAASGTLSSPCSAPGTSSASPSSSGPASSSSGSPMTDNAELSIRPNIRFASKHGSSLFEGLRRTAK